VKRVVLKMFSKKTIFVLSLCFVVVIGTVATYAYLLNQRGASNEPDFVFTWGPDTQKIVNGTFRLEIWLTLEGENLTIIIKANDNDYGDDFAALVFDTDQNGYLDTKDEAYALDADNKTTTGSRLEKQGSISVPLSIPELGPHRVTFDSKTGYTFVVNFPWVDQYGREWNPAPALKIGERPYFARNPLHVVFGDGDSGNVVFVQFQFYIFEEAE
jgi:hypothetical protein